MCGGCCGNGGSERLLVGVGRLRGATDVCTDTVMLDMTALLLGRCLGATDVPSVANSDCVCPALFLESACCKPLSVWSVLGHNSLEISGADTQLRFCTGQSLPEILNATYDTWNMSGLLSGFTSNIYDIKECSSFENLELYGMLKLPL